MVYLENKTELQELWIPRNDGQGVPYNPTKELEGVDVTISQDITVVNPSSGYYGMSAVTIDASEYGQSNYDEGFDDGYTDGYSSGTSDGEQSIIDTFTSTTITINGQYGSSANPYSSVTVNVAQTGHTDEELQEAYESGYTSGSTDGYNSGYTSGETHQKSLLVSTAFTQNGQYTRENGWNGVTVNIDTASTYNSGYTSGYTSGHTDGIDEEKAKMSAVTFTANTAVTLSDGSYSAVTVNVPQTGSTAVLGVGSFSANGTYSASTDNLDGYSAITVNVPQTGGSGVKYIEYLETDGTNIVYDTGINITSNNVKIYLDYMRLSGSTENYLNIVSQVYNDRKFSYAFFVPGNWNTRGGVMPRFGGDNYEIPSLLDTYYETVVSNTGTTINGVDYPYIFTSFQETDEHMYLNAQHYYGYFRRFAIARYYRFAVESGGTLLVDMRPCLDENNIPCFYDEVSETYIYHTGTGTPIAGPVLDPSYASGYTDGQNSIINTFTAMTATTNGVYGSSAHPLSSITVNVPTSGGSVISLVDSIYTQSMDWDSTKCIDTKITATTATTMRIGYVGAGIGSDRVIGYAPQDGTSDNDDWRFFNVFGNTNTVDLNTSRKQGGSPTIQSGVYYDITLGNNYLYDNINESYIVQQGNVQSSLTPMSIRVDVGSQKVKFVEIKNNGITVFNGQAAIDNDGNIGLYDSISQSMVYNSGLTMAYEGTPTPIPSQDYQSGYTDGYASGYTDGASSSQSDLSKLVDKSITQADLQSGCTKIGSYAFYMCSYLTGVTIPNTVTEIGQYAFQSCYRLNEVNIPDSVVYIRNNAFYGCEAISSVTFGNSIEQIGICAFQDCKSLTTASIPDSIRKISDGAFWGCTALTEVYIGSGITEFTAGAGTYGVFTGCDSLTDVYLYATTPPSYSQYTFTGVNHSITLHCPVGSDYSSYSIPSYWSIVYDL